jgi:hypothetical protein
MLRYLVVHERLCDSALASIASASSVAPMSARSWSLPSALMARRPGSCATALTGARTEGRAFPTGTRLSYKECSSGKSPRNASVGMSMCDMFTTSRKLPTPLQKRFRRCD